MVNDALYQLYDHWIPYYSIRLSQTHVIGWDTFNLFPVQPASFSRCLLLVLSLLNNLVSCGHLCWRPSGQILLSPPLSSICVHCPSKLTSLVIYQAELCVRRRYFWNLCKHDEILQLIYRVNPCSHWRFAAVHRQNILIAMDYLQSLSRQMILSEDWCYYKTTVSCAIILMPIFVPFVVP